MYNSICIFVRVLMDDVQCVCVFMEAVLVRFSLENCKVGVSSRKCMSVYTRLYFVSSPGGCKCTVYSVHDIMGSVCI